MLEIHRILVPYDFSDAAGDALRYASGFAAYFDAEVTVLYVLPPLRYDFAMTEPSADRAKELNAQRLSNARAALEAVVPKLVSRNDIRCLVVEGDPAHEIVTSVNEGHYDAVVMSTLGAGAFRRWFIIGSVTAKVLHAAERPVITSAHFEKHPSPLSIDRVLSAIDLGPQSAKVLCWASRAAELFDASLIIGHAAADLGEATAAVEEESWRATAASRLRDRIDELKRIVQVEAEALIEFDHPARAISDMASRTQADLVVLGRGVSQGLIGRLRANAYDIIRQCPCPVVSV